MKFLNYITENLVISDKDSDIEHLKLQFTERNIKKIAYNYDAKIEKIEMDSKHAVLKDNHGRLLFVDLKRGRK